MQWGQYRNWCADKGLPMLVRPAGVGGIGDHVYNDEDGFLYVKGKPVGKFLTLCRYSGIDILLKADNIDNAKRFEALRWKVLLRTEALYQQQGVVVERLFEHLKRPGKTVKTMYGGKLVVLRLVEDREFGRRAVGDPVAHYDRLNPLDKMSSIPKDSPTVRLATRWFELRARIERFNSIAGNLTHCLRSILQTLHPDSQEKRYSFRRPCFFEINGRSYPILPVQGSRDIDYWPDPVSTLARVTL
ncbi:MAG: hypothetical protein AB7L09_00425 [Nitrospira sp.]